MKLPLHIIILALTSSILIGCTGSKSMYKKGKKLEEAGLNYEASDFYINALRRKPSNSDAILALKKTGQEVLDDQFSKFYQFYTNENAKEAVYSYLEAEAFKQKVENVNVRLTAAPYYSDYFKEVKTLYIQSLYESAQKDLDIENFSEAEDKLKEIQKLEPTYKNVQELSNFAFVEPKYRMAIKAYDNDENRKAYHLFDEIVKASGNYKESKELMAIAKENARYTIGILKFENSSKIPGAESAMSGTIVRDLMRLNDPFLVVIDRTNTEKLISEQKLGMTGIIDQSSAAKAGELLGAKAILVGKVTSAEKRPGKLIKRSTTGYLGKKVVKVNPETGNKYTKMVYSKVYYYTYEQQNKVNVTFQYQLISTETGEILISDVVERSMEDKISYAYFNGDSRYLFGGTWASKTKANSNDKIYNSYSAKRELDNSLKARKEIRSVENLSNEVYGFISKKVSLSIKNYNPEG